MNEIPFPEKQLILYVENNPDDVALFRMAMKKCGVRFVLEAVSTAEEGKRFLRRRSAEKMGELAFVLLDYNLGVVHSGMELLSTIHREAGISSVPVIVYCGDKFEELILQAYEAGADYFLEKPDHYDGLIRMVRCLDECLKSTPIHLEGVRELPEYQPPVPFPSWRGLRRLV